MKTNPARRGGNGNNARYKGVRMRKWGKWVAEVRQPNSRTRIWLGSYETEKEAARAYDAGVFFLHGPSTSLNFPEDPPPDILAAPDSLSTSQIQVAAAKHARRGDAVPIPVGEEEEVEEDAVNIFSESSGVRQIEAGECYSFHDQIEQLSMGTVYPPFTGVEPERDVPDVSQVVFYEL